jgi:hypothetical protein
MISGARVNGAATSGSLVLLPFSCTVPVGGLVIVADGGPGAGITEAWTINEATNLASPGSTNATNATCSLSGSGTGTNVSTCTNSTASLTFNAGDFITLQLAISGGTVGTQVVKMAINCH